ncbi:MAG: hypothetical protein JJT99_12230 [Rhodobacteraceae bacterium]|nr:hypothetical protein [Paracoccaceae bacterium]
MLMFMGLFGALMAGVAADALLSGQRTSGAGADDGVGPDSPDDDDSEEWTGRQGNLLAEAALAAGGGDDDTTLDDNSDPEPDQPEGADIPGLFDDLGERIHSSDSYPEPDPPMPEYLLGDERDQLLEGGDLDDTLIGGSGNDTLAGHAGDDWLQAGQGESHLIGGSGNDTLIGGPGDDRLEGNAGDDLLIAGQGSNTLLGGSGDDTLVGVALDESGQDISGRNFLNGGEGDDLLIAGQGDYLNGGPGADRFALGDWLEGLHPATIVDYTAPEDQIVLHYDPVRMAAPELAVTHSEADPMTAQIWLNGHLIANVANAPDLGVQDIALIAEHPEQMLGAAQ